MDYLVEKGYARYTSLGPPTAAITSGGIDFIEAPSDFSKPKDSIQQSIRVSGDVGQIFQAKEVTINLDLFLKHMTRFAEETPKLSPEEKKHWLKFLKHPLLIEIVRQAFESIKVKF